MTKLMSTSPLFDRYANAFGGTIGGDLQSPDVESWEFELGQIFGIVLGAAARTANYRNAHGQHLKLEAGVVSDESANAFADTFDGTHVIGLNIGQYLAGGHIARELILKRGGLRDIGRPVARPVETSFSLVHNPADMASADDSALDCDPTRLKAAAFIRHTMLMFVLTHEYFHVVGGHCAIMRSWRQPARLQEVTAVGTRDFGDARRSWHFWFEYLADMRAVQFLTGLIVRDLDFYTSAGLMAFDRSARLRMLIVAVGLLFALWHRLESGLSSRIRLHPTPATRFVMMANAIRSAATELGSDPHDLTELLRTAINDLADASRFCPDIGSGLMRVTQMQEKQWPEHAALALLPEAALEELEHYAFAALN